MSLLAASLESVVTTLSSAPQDPTQMSSALPTNITAPLNTTNPRNVSISLNSTTPTFELNQSMQPALITNDAIIIPLGAVFVGLRFFARWKRGLEYGMDDWMIAVALCELPFLLGASLNMIYRGLGRHTSALTLTQVVDFEKAIVAFQCIYVTILTTVKIAVLMMYTRIFPLRKVRITAYILGGLSLSWGVSMVLVSIFRCSPIAKAWDNFLPGNCINFEGAIISNAIPNILTDTAIISIPIPLLWHLHTGFIQKIVLTGVFLLGSFVIFTSIYRFTTLLTYNPLDPTWSLSQVFAFGVVECSAGIISACLPTLGPLIHLPSITSRIKRVSRAITRVSNAFSFSRSTSRERNKKKVSEMGEGEERGMEMGVSGEMSDRERKRDRERKVDVEDVGEGIKRPAFFKLPSSREGRLREGGQNVKGKSSGERDSEKGEMGTDGASEGMKVRNRTVLGKSKEE